MTELSTVGERNEIGKYLFAVRLPDQEGRKTHRWSIYSKSTREKLAEIKWFGRWRQYCLYSGQDTIFNEGCLEDLTTFLRQLKGIKHE